MTEERESRGSGRESAATAADFSLQRAAILNALPAHIALLDDRGIIVAVNEAWRRFTVTNALASASFAVGDSYLEVCEVAAASLAEARLALDGIRAVLSRR